MTNNIQDKIVVITGASSGMGEATARHLAQQGAKVVLGARRAELLINNAGIMPLSRLETLMVDEWEQMIDVNIKGVLYGIAAALPHMRAQKSGHIITTASVAGHLVFPASAVYSGTKFAVRAICEGLRQEVKEYNIRTTILCPGAVKTELLDHISDEAVRAANSDYVNQVGISADSYARIAAFANL